jgi:hypothetical protein
VRKCEKNFPKTSFLAFWTKFAPPLSCPGKKTFHLIYIGRPGLDKSFYGDGDIQTDTQTDTEANTIARPLYLFFITIVIIKEGRAKNRVLER